MKEKDWIEFKVISEEEFKKATIQECWGFQIQKETKWNNGLSVQEIEKLEGKFGFTFPVDYFEMLKVINGFNTPQISIDPDGENDDKFERRCYKFPDDIDRTKSLVDQTLENIEYANEALEDSGFDPNQVEGFIPLYGHRVLVVLKDKQKSPVLSMWGNDIIVYGTSLIKYWCNEFEIDFKKNKST